MPRAKGYKLGPAKPGTQRFENLQARDYFDDYATAEQMERLLNTRLPKEQRQKLPNRLNLLTDAGYGKGKRNPWAGKRDHNSGVFPFDERFPKALLGSRITKRRLINAADGLSIAPTALSAIRLFGPEAAGDLIAFHYKFFPTKTRITKREVLDFVENELSLFKNKVATEYEKSIWGITVDPAMVLKARKDIREANYGDYEARILQLNRLNAARSARYKKNIAAPSAGGSPAVKTIPGPATMEAMQLVQQGIALTPHQESLIRIATKQGKLIPFAGVSKKR